MSSGGWRSWALSNETNSENPKNRDAAAAKRSELYDLLVAALEAIRGDLYLLDIGEQVPHETVAGIRATVDDLPTVVTFRHA